MHKDSLGLFSLLVFLKHSEIMSVTLSFHSVENAVKSHVKAYVNSSGLLYITVFHEEDSITDEINMNHAVLDKATAVRLVKEIKRQISLMDQQDGK